MSQPAQSESGRTVSGKDAPGAAKSPAPGTEDGYGATGAVVDQGHSSLAQTVDFLAQRSVVARPGLILQLQQTHGNHYVQRLVSELRATRPASHHHALQRDAGVKRTQANDVSALIEKYVSTDTSGDIPLDIVDTKGLYAELAGMLPAQAAFAGQVIDKLKSSYHVNQPELTFATALSDDTLATTAADAAGKTLLFKLVTAMQGLTVSKDEKSQLYRVLSAIAKVQNAQTGNVEVEVITFESGVGVMDKAGEFLYRAGVRGHTAISVGGIVYSFDERGWVSEGPRDAYMAMDRNTSRDGSGQVLDIPQADAGKIQDALNNKVGTGTYFFNSNNNICVDEVAKVLVGIIGNFNAENNPQQLKAKLTATGKVKNVNSYPKKGGAMPSTYDQKLRTLNGLLDGWVGDKDLKAFDLIFNSETKDQDELRKTLAPRVNELRFERQRKMLRKIMGIPEPSPK